MERFNFDREFVHYETERLRQESHRRIAVKLMAGLFFVVGLLVYAGWST
jgi:hypothetical protein